MGKTADLRKLVVTLLNQTTGKTYYMIAPDDAEFPYKVFTLTSIDLNDMSRDDYIVEVDVWDYSVDPKTVDEICDNIDSLLNGKNAPEDTILPTFFRSSRGVIEDEDKNIKHVRMNFNVQMYENE